MPQVNSYKLYKLVDYGGVDDPIGLCLMGSGWSGTGTAVEAMKNLIARLFVFQTLPKDILLQVAKNKDAKDVWEDLRVRYFGAERVKKGKTSNI